MIPKPVRPVKEPKRPKRSTRPIRRRVTLGAKRRAAKAAGHVDEFSLEEVLRIQGGLCAYCGTAPATTRDHVKPLARGGRDHISNIVGACWPCNSRKGTQTWEPLRRHQFMEAAV